MLETLCWIGLFVGFWLLVDAERISHWTNGGKPTCCGWAPFCKCADKVKP